MLTKAQQPPTTLQLLVFASRMVDADDNTTCLRQSLNAQIAYERVAMFHQHTNRCGLTIPVLARSTN
jgi:hypothetical protein